MFLNVKNKVLIFDNQNCEWHFGKNEIHKNRNSQLKHNMDVCNKYLPLLVIYTLISKELNMRSQKVYHSYAFAQITS